MTDTPASSPASPAVPETAPAIPESEGAATESAAMRPWYASALLALCAVVVVLASAWAFTRSKSAYPFFGTAMDGNPPAATFSGTDDLGQPYTFAPDGKTTSAIFFGFTHCANICPLSLKYLNVARDRLKATQKNNFQVIFISVDPDRDTPQLIHDYVTFFGEGKGIRIPEPALSKTAKDYFVGYQKVDVKGLEYQINHTTGTYLIDATGHLRAVWDYTQLPQVDRVVQDIEYVMENPSR